MEDDGSEHATRSGHHVSKRARRNKGLVIVFDADARKEFVTGFQKRKKKRRKLAEKQKQHKERQKRLQERRERRLAMAEALGQGEQEVENEETVEERSQDLMVSNEGRAQEGTVMYEDECETTVVNTFRIELDRVESKTSTPSSKSFLLKKSMQIQRKRNFPDKRKQGKHSKRNKRS